MQTINWQEHLELFTGAVAPNRRMSEKLLAFYSDHAAKNVRSHCSSGICIKMLSDAEKLFVKFVFGATAREIFTCDIAVDGKVFTIDGREGGLLELEPGEKEIIIYMPHLAVIEDFTLQLNEGAFFRAAVNNQKKLLLCGDSIMQGMTCTTPAKALGVIAAAALGLTLHNTSVGGAVMRYEVVEDALKLAGRDDVFVVGFGINDASRKTPLDEFKMHTEKVVQMLDGFSGTAFIVTPLPTFNPAEENRQLYSNIIRECVKRYPRVNLLEGESFFPLQEDLLADGLHPNDKGMQVYAAGLTAAIQKKR